MFDRGQFLGRVPLRGMGQPWFSGPSGTPFFGYGSPAAAPYGYFANPQGTPLMTEEVTSPEESHIAREFHCYRAPNSDPNDPKSYRSVPMALRDAYLAAGWVAVPYENCGPAQGAPLSAAPVGATSFIAPSRMGRRMGQDVFIEDEDPGPSGGGGGSPGGVVAGAPTGGPSGPSGGFGPVGPVAPGPQPMPISNPSPAGGFPGIFPTAGPGNSLFLDAGFGGGGWGWPYPYPPPPGDYECRWEETPPKEDTPLLCRPAAPRYPVAWGPPGWGFW
jgi:hypothetical protein